MSDVHAAVLAAAYRRRAFKLTSLQAAFVAVRAEWAGIMGATGAERVVRTSLDSMHKLAHGEIEPTAVEWAAWCSHVGPDVVCRAHADVLGWQVGAVSADDADALVTAARAAELVSRAVTLSAVHRSPSSAGGSDVVASERDEEVAVLEGAKAEIERAIAARQVRA